MSLGLELCGWHLFPWETPEKEARCRNWSPAQYSAGVLGAEESMETRKSQASQPLRTGDLLRVEKARWRSPQRSSYGGPAAVEVELV